MKGSPVISISFSVVEDDLGPDETVPVDFVVEALTLGEEDPGDDRPGELGTASRPGIMEALIPLDVDGMPAPTGFVLHAKVLVPLIRPFGVLLFQCLLLAWCSPSQ